MDKRGYSELRVGRCTGVIREPYQAADLLEALSDMPALLGRPDSVVVAASRNRNVKVSVTCHGRPLDLIAKDFAPEGWLKDVIDRRRGSKARRTWQTAMALHGRGVGTPAPVGFMERREGGRLTESYFIAEYAANATSFGAELIRLFRHDARCEKFMALMQTVADAVRRMHDAGVLHNDLGNQNILLRRTGEAAWGDVQFIDLNRALVRAALGPRRRARDISRLHLPSDFLRVFKEMYYAGEAPPRQFQRWERFYRRAYAAHCATRAVRHPLRTRRVRREQQGAPSGPEGRELWVWDERSGQAVSTLLPRDRGRFRAPGDVWRVAGAVCRAAWPVRRAYRALRAQCYATPVAMKNRICVAINPEPATVEQQIGLLRRLGPVPVLIRFCHHERGARGDALAGVARALHAAGHPVNVALVQDRAAVRDPAAWRAFVEQTLAHVGGFVQWVEVGHAINRVKWGIWDLAEHRRLLEATAAAAERFPGVRFAGPALIDFEAAHLAAAVRNMAAGPPFWALSQHLYVDRRGAPEARQDGFSALEKFVMARAMARCAPRVEDRLIVSEVNWPLRGTGVYSPVGSPYVSPGPRFGDPSVSEDDYADYMIRYLLMALCSGMVEQVCWWRLVARGYGLVDDLDPAHWRERPAYGMLLQFRGLIGDGRFLRREEAAGGAAFFHFDTPGAGRVCLAISPAGQQAVSVPFAYAEAADAFGRRLHGGGVPATLSGRPVYLLGCGDQGSASTCR